MGSHHFFKAGISKHRSAVRHSSKQKKNAEQGKSYASWCHLRNLFIYSKDGKCVQHFKSMVFFLSGNVSKTNLGSSVRITKPHSCNGRNPNR